MLEGLLVDLVPVGKAFDERAVEWRNGPMREWWGIDGLLTRAAHQRWLEERRSRSFPRHRGAFFGMRTKDGVPIGTFGLMHIDPAHRTAEVGAGIGEPEYWGGGFGSDAMLLVVQYAFDWLDLRRLWLSTFGHNVRAQRQVEKCGFTREVTGRRKMLSNDGHYRDWLYYGLLRSEWPGRAAMVERLGLREKARARGWLAE